MKCHMHMLGYVLNLYLKKCKVKTAFHHSANDYEMRCVSFPEVGFKHTTKKTTVNPI